MKLILSRPRDVLTLLLLMSLPGLLSGERQTKRLNGFDVGNATVPLSGIAQGGPPRDGIPALQRPKFIAADAAGAPLPQQRVLGLSIAGDARAYPVGMMNWHELVNDRVGGQPVLISYCPLCGTGMAFSARAGGRELDFGVSGLLYNSDVLMYDRQTGSLWSQLLAKAISGPLVGTRLKQLVLEHTRWRDWLQRHPRGRVLSPDTGYQRDYSRNPYLAYGQRQGLMFAVSHHDDRYPAKSWVLGVEIDDHYRAYPFDELRRLAGPVKDSVAGRVLRIVYDHENRSARVFATDGTPLPTVSAYWFAWIAFHPDSSVFRVP